MWEYTVKSVNKEKFVLRSWATTAVKKKKKSLQFICLSAVCLSLAVGYSPFSALFFFFYYYFHQPGESGTSPHVSVCCSEDLLMSLQHCKAWRCYCSGLLFCQHPFPKKDVWAAVWAHSRLHWQSSTFLVALVVVKENLERHSQQANQVIDIRFSLTEKCYSANTHLEKCPGTDWTAHQQMNEATKNHAAHLVSLNNSHKTFLQL